MRRETPVTGAPASAVREAAERTATQYWQVQTDHVQWALTADWLTGMSFLCDQMGDAELGGDLRTLADIARAHAQSAGIARAA